MIQDKPFLPVITLIGDPIENFYRLGKQDKENYRPVLDEIKALMQTPWKSVDKGVKEAGLFLIKNAFSNASPFRKHVEAYAEGLEISFEEVALGLLVPEIISSLNRWVPTITTKNLGCSSYFMIDEEKNHPVHLRLLDFPLVGSFDIHERLLVTQFKGEATIFSHGSAGLPYNSLTCMNSHGVTLAIHQKYTDIFNPHGTPVFELVRELMAHVKDPHSALEFLNKKQSLSSWGLYMLFKSGEVLAVDLLGEKIEHQLFELKERQVLSFNNLLLNKRYPQKKIIPYNFHQYCKMREDCDHKKIKSLLKTGPLTELDLIKRIMTPLKSEEESFKKWEPDSATPITVAAMTMNPQKQSSLYIPGLAPKYFSGQVVSLTSQKSGIKQKLLEEECDFPPTLWKEGMKRLILGMQAYQKKEIHQTYHEVQMACQMLEGYPEHKLAKLYFDFYRFLNEEEKENRQDILKDLKELKDDLPSYLRDQCMLFIWRLERLIGKKSKISADDIESPALKKVWELENKIPKLLHYKLTAPFTHPRPDILDVVYAYLLQP